MSTELSTKRELDYEQAHRIADRFPLRPLERHRVASEGEAAMSDIRDRYGDQMANLLGVLVFQNEPTIDHTLRAAQLLRAETIMLSAGEAVAESSQSQAQEHQSARTQHRKEARKRQGEAARLDQEHTVDAQIALLLTDPEVEPHRQKVVDYLRGLRREIEKALGNSNMNITQKGVAGVRDNGLDTVGVQSILDADDVVNRYIASTPDLGPTLKGLVTTRDSEYAETYGDLQKRRKAAFALYQEIMKQPSIVSMHKDDISNLLDICMNLCSTSPKSLTLSIGLGGTEKDPSTRVPVYIVPSLTLMGIFKRYHDDGMIENMPTLRLMYAGHAASTVNDMESAKVHEAGVKMRLVLAKFIETFAPSIQDHVVIVSDSSMSIPSEEQASALLEQANIDDQAAAWIERRAKQMHESGRVAGSLDAARASVRQYIVCHPILMGDMQSTEWDNLSDESPDMVMSMGGNMEAVFNYFRRETTLGQEAQRDPGTYTPLNVRLVQAEGKHVPYDPINDVDTPITAVAADTPILLDRKTVEARQATADSGAAKSIASDYRSLGTYVQASESDTRNGPEVALRDFFAQVEQVLRERDVT